MKVKRYLGSTTQEAMYKLKSELGSDAIILNTRTVKRKGIIGFFQKPLIEIVAAVDEKTEIEKENEHNNELNNINEELVRLRSLMESVHYKTKSRDRPLGGGLEKYRNIMVKNGVHYNVATCILENIENQVNFSGKDDSAIKSIINYNILEFLKPVEPISIDKNQKVIFFVGPTGVGKTTSLAKIAAKLVLEGNYSVGLITADTYRIAAVEQLKVYSDILKLPLKIIYEPSEIYKALAELREKSIILVDTAGRSHKDKEQILETKRLINTVLNKEVYLVLGTNTDFITLKTIVEQYKFIEQYKIIFTKLDEAESYGNILNIKFHTSNPLSYFTTGQNVPDDIEIANPKKIANILIGEK